MMADTRTHIANVRKIELETLQNGTHGANLANLQGIAHRDIATDRTWNVDEMATLTAKSGVQADAMISAGELASRPSSSFTLSLNLRAIASVISRVPD